MDISAVLFLLMDCDIQKRWWFSNVKFRRNELWGMLAEMFLFY